MNGKKKGDKIDGPDGEEITIEAQMDANALKAWYNKYEDMDSYDAYRLANGFFKWKLDSGIATDAMEKSEVEALIKKFGEEEVMDDPFGAMEKAPELAPITTAMHKEFSQIVGKKYPDEEDFEKASNIIQDIDEDSVANMKDLIKGVLKNPLKGDKEAKKANKKHGRDLAGNKLDDNIIDIARLAGIK